MVGAYATLELALARNAAAMLVLAVVLPITAAAASVRFIPTTALHPAYFDVADAQQAQRDARRARAPRRRRRGHALLRHRHTVGATASRACWVRSCSSLALARARQDRVARYVAAATGVAATRHHSLDTGWLLGKLLTPFHLWRILAAVPFGIGRRVRAARPGQAYLERAPGRARIELVRRAALHRLRVLR